MPSLQPIWTATSIVRRFSNGQSRGSATGFFYLNNENLYLVTNKHVIYGDNYVHGQPIIDTIGLNVHTNANNLTQNEEVMCPLFEGAARKWLEHEHPAVDVVLLPLTFERARYVIAPIDRTLMDLTTKQGQIVVDDFEKIFIMGYPFGWYDSVNNLPITRIGHLSSPFRVPFQNMPLMMGDVVTHEGMSGGPVFMILQDFTVEGPVPAMPPIPGRANQQIGRMKMLGQRKLLLVGVNPGQFAPVPFERVNLSAIWFPDVMSQILEQVQH